jgi:hypothetical protein
VREFSEVFVKIIENTIVAVSVGASAFAFVALISNIVYLVV